MHAKPYAVTAAIAAAVLLTACEQRQDTARAPAPQPPASTLAAAAADTKDPSLPPADAALSSPKSAQDGKATALTPAERDREMPMKGQVNDYNTPDRAKEGDQPNTAAKEPGGQEAHPGNYTTRDQTSNAKEGKQ